MMRSNALFRLAEQVGEAASLAGWALREACRMAMTWPDDRAMVSVRIPPELQRPSLLNLHLAEALELSGLAPERLELRLAEPDLAELGADELLGLCAVRDLGVGVALEHFGTGATSLALLRRLPLSTITLDAALSRHAPQDREDSAILRAILAATRALGLESVADGVQSEAQRQFLVSAGCDGAQGTLLGPDGPQSHLLRKMRLG
jgi:EAL domain-containing protein (putative c-di-GMP-specific phosphodiesterase class I)